MHLKKKKNGDRELIMVLYYKHNHDIISQTYFALSS